LRLGTKIHGGEFLSRKELIMAGEKGNRGAQDRNRVAGEQGYDVRHFAERHGIAQEQAEQLIARHGNDREALDQAAQQMSG
jgi:hypothetical protein